MSTFGEMKARIADEIARSDLTTQVGRSIISAIQHYQRKKFYFNEDRSVTFSTVIGQEFYTASDAADIPNFSDIDEATITVNGDRLPVEKRPYSYIEEISSTTTNTGIPYVYSYYARQIRLYPIPQAVYTVRVSGLKRMDTLSADTDTNVWMTEAEALIRCRAKMILALEVTKDDAEVARLAPAEQSLLQMIETETTMRSTSRITPQVF